MSTVAVIGGGVAGLAAAWTLAAGARGHHVVLLEAGQRVGGVLAPVDLALPAGSGDRDTGLGTGVGAVLRLDGGVESLLARRAEATDLARAVGLGDDLVTPATTSAAVSSRGRLHPLPAGTLLGVPGDPEALRGLLTDAEVARAAAEVLGPPVTADVSVAAWVAGRLGPAVVERLVEPLLGGVYAGSASGLSLRAALPGLWPAAHAGTSALAAVRRATAAGAAVGGPVFAGVRGGVWRLGEALAAAVVGAGVDLRCRTRVTSLHQRGARWRLELAADRGEEVLEVDAVVLALPAAAASGLLAGAAPEAAGALAGVPSASLALVTAVLPVGALSGEPALAGLSGVLVPPVEGRLVKAMTFSSAKWAWVADAAGGLEVLRLSVGRHGDDAALALDDDDLVAAVLADAGHVLGVPLRPVASALTRWGSALPQYGVGHVDRVAGIRSAVAAVPRLSVAGATFDGVGVPATVASARRAATEVLAALG